MHPPAHFRVKIIGTLIFSLHLSGIARSFPSEKTVRQLIERDRTEQRLIYLDASRFLGFPEHCC
jgi:hypothetical protein